MDLGARLSGNSRYQFSVWAPLRKNVELQLLSPLQRLVRMEKDDRGYWHASVDGTPPATEYMYRLDEAVERPDPASRYQPHGVHGPSSVVDPAFTWNDPAWRGIPLAQYIMYELHVGTFTPEGTFDSVIGKLDDLLDLGITAVELMPVGQFPGDRNWGYDGAYPFAVQDSYGGPDGLKRLVNACHQKGLAVILDVVYNHFGPEGSYIGEFGPYFTNHYTTPWGNAVNLDGPYSDEVRNYFIENAMQWLRDFHIDALRLDAIHAMYDFSARPFLQELAERIEELNRAGWQRFLIAESDLNDTRVIRPRELGGLGLDSQWSDDFHHSLQTLIVEDRGGYYVDFGHVGDLAKALSHGFVYTGQYSAFRRRRHGNSSQGYPPEQFVICTQNHDQVGNRILGERLCAQVPFEKLKLAAAAMLLSPNLPLLFMGEEYAEEAPFLYFVSHSDHSLIEAINKGRKEEFAHFLFPGDPPGVMDLETFTRSKLRWDSRAEGQHATMLQWYRTLIRLRKEETLRGPAEGGNAETTVDEQRRILTMAQGKDEGCCVVGLSFSPGIAENAVALPGGTWTKILDSAAVQWDGPGESAPSSATAETAITMLPFSCVVYRREKGA